MEICCYARTRSSKNNLKLLLGRKMKEFLHLLPQKIETIVGHQARRPDQILQAGSEDVTSATESRAGFIPEDYPHPT